MHRTLPIAIVALFLLAPTSATLAGGGRSGKRVAPRGDAPTNAPVFRDLDRSVKKAASGTPLSRAFRVPRAKAKGGRAYTVKPVDATLVERTRHGRAAVQLELMPHSRAVKSSTLRVPSRTRRGAELAVHNREGHIEVSVRDPERGEVWAALSFGPKAPARVGVTYYVLPPGEHMRTRPPTPPEEAAVFFAAMGGFQPARNTRAGRAVADFARRLEKTARGLSAEEQRRIAPLIELLRETPVSGRDPVPVAGPRTARRSSAGEERRETRPNAALFAAARSSLRIAAQGTPLTRQERVAARPGERAYTVGARTASLRQDGEHGPASLHIENGWGREFKPRSARVMVPGTGARASALELSYTPHRMRIELRDPRRGLLRIALDSDVDRPGGVRYSIVDVAGSGQPAEVTPAEALRFVRDIGGFQPAPGTRAGVAVRELAAQLAATARSRPPGEQAELAPLIAALGGPR
jgi:hypothetical protein